MKKVKNTSVRLLLGLLAACCSCTKEQKAPGIYVDETDILTIDQMKPRDVIFKINGEKVTKADYVDLLDLRCALFKIGAGIPISHAHDDRVEEFRASRASGVVPELIHRTLFRQYAEKNGIIPTKEEVDKATEKFASVLKLRVSDLPLIAKEIGGNAGRGFAKIPYVDAQDAALRQSVSEGDINLVTDEEIAKREAFVKKFDENAEMENKKSRAALLEARAKILGGEDFREVTKRYAKVHPEYGEKWGEFEIGEIPEDSDLRKWLVTAKVGDVSEPIDMEDGIAIVKVLSKKKGEAPKNVEAPDVYVLARCTAYAFEFMRHQERPELIRQLKVWKHEEAQKQLGKMLMGAAVIECPHGTNFFASAILQ